MTGSTDEPSRFIRARQRDRNASVVGFDQALSPDISQIGVDRMTLTVGGRWRSNASNGIALFDGSLHSPGVDWFNRPAKSPAINPRSVSVQMAKPSRSTISGCKITAHQLQADNGPVTIELDLNPTRTLAHILSDARHSAHAPEQFMRAIEHLSTHQFFARSDARIFPALDGSDNWLPSTRYLRERMGSAYWELFLPIFFDQVRRLCNAMLSEYPHEIENAPTNVIHLAQGSVHMSWSDIRVPSIECYFERYHAQAVGAVRRGGTAVMAADHSNDLWRYVSETSSSHRENDRFSVGIKLTNMLRLAIYAKLPDRIRFEVRRKGKGDYSALPAPADGNMRLIDIVEQERRQLLDIVRWDTIGELFAGSDHPQLHDVAELIEQVCAAVACDTAHTAALLKALLIEGAISAAAFPHDIIARLRQQGIIERLRIRRRDLNGRPARYVLTAPYRDIHAAFVDSIGQRLP